MKRKHTTAAKPTPTGLAVILRPLRSRWGIQSPGVDSPGVDSPGVDSPGVDSPGVDSPAMHKASRQRSATPVIDRHRCNQLTARGSSQSANSAQHSPGYQQQHLSSDLEDSPLAALRQTGGDLGIRLQGIPVEVAN